VQEALQLYSGALLDGWYHEWCLYERERFLTMYLAMCDKLIGYCEAESRYDEGVAYGLRILRHDRARERTHRALMRLYYLAGDRTGALRQYERCAAALSDELGVRPARSTAALYEQISAERVERGTRIEAGSGPPAAMTPLQEALAHLERLGGALTRVQREVDIVTQAIERALQRER
jgi:DNA-binding SARP family transcriptional activator